MKELGKRVVVGVVFIPYLLLLLWVGGTPLQVFIGLVIAMGTYELRKLFDAKGVFFSFLLIPANIVLFIAVTQWRWEGTLLVMFSTVCLLFGRVMFRPPFKDVLLPITAGIFSMIYPTMFLSTLYLLRTLQNGRAIVMLLIATVWATDILAFFGGLIFGRHRGLVKASPTKSLEGYIAGILGAAGLNVAVYFLLPDFFTIQEVVVCFLGGSLAAQYGDILESVIKRDAGVKNSSEVIPGHGGFLDRFDSLLLASPFAYLLLKVWAEVM